MKKLYVREIRMAIPPFVFLATSPKVNGFAELSNIIPGVKPGSMSHAEIEAVAATHGYEITWG